MKRAIQNFSFSLGLLLLLPLVSGATGGGTGGIIENPLQYDNFVALLEAILNVVVEIGIPILVLMMVYVGLKFVMARGNSSQIEEAKKAFLWLVVGAFIVLGSFAISEMLQNTVNLIKA